MKLELLILLILIVYFANTIIWEYKNNNIREEKLKKREEQVLLEEQRIKKEKTEILNTLSLILKEEIKSKIKQCDENDVQCNNMQSMYNQMYPKNNENNDQMNKIFLYSYLTAKKEVEEENLIENLENELKNK